MAPKKSKHKLVAKVVSGKKVPCGFCQREVDDELTYGKLYAIGDIQCHYFCVLLSSCLVQKGKDEDGLFGFLYEDIIKEIERAKKHRCSYCGRGGANLGCSVSQCRKQFHLPCGRERNAVSMFYGNYKSFCQSHAPKQFIPPTIMAKAKQRMKYDNKAKKKDPNFRDLKELSAVCENNEANTPETESVCVICYEAVDGYPTVNTFWPPCCGRDAWFHRSCLQRMALSAGMHYLKCPLCNDKENFYQAVVTQGYYVPDRDAAWELEQNAFAEIYEREVVCSAKECLCPLGRNHDADHGSWCIKLCLLCGSSGAHSGCRDVTSSDIFVCVVCTPAAPPTLEQLADCIQAVINQEQTQTTSRVRRGPVMPSRMSLRRTKPQVHSYNMPSCSSSVHRGVTSNIKENQTEVSLQPSTNTEISRQDLNLKPPQKSKDSEAKNASKSDKNKLSEKENKGQSPIKPFDFKTHSPMKILEESLKENMGNNTVVDNKLVEELRIRFRKPKPLSEKRKIVNDILNGVFDNMMTETKQKEPSVIKKWCSPKKCELTEIIDFEATSPPNADQMSPNNNLKSPKTDQMSPINKLESPKSDQMSPNNNHASPKPEQMSPIQQEKAITPKKSPIKFCFKNCDPQINNMNNCIMFNTPKKLKTIDILNDSSLEISAKDEIINIDVIKLENSQNDEFLKTIDIRSPIKSKKRAFKFSPCNKEILTTDNVDIDLESFKDRYLNEVGLQRIDKTVKNEESKKSRKRKLGNDKLVLKYKSKKRKKQRKNISIKDKNIKVKIKWRREQLKLKITDAKKKKKSKKFKQYVLEYSPKSSGISKPKIDVTPIKRKYVKQEKTPDNLVQTSIQSFFKVKSPSN